MTPSAITDPNIQRHALDCHFGRATDEQAESLRQRLVDLQETRESISKPHHLLTWEAAGMIDEELAIVAALAAYDHRVLIEKRRGMIHEA